MKRRLPSLNALRAFEAAARHCSFRNAAAELNVSHSAISHQVKSLEHQLNIELFIRSARAVELTLPGKRYYHELRDALDRIDSATRELLNPQDRRTLTVQVYSTFAVRWLVPRLERFRTAQPDIQIRLISAQTNVDFSNEDVDAAVWIGDPDEQDIHYDFLFHSQVFPVCSPSLLNGQPPLEKPDDLRHHQILQVYPSPEDWSLWLAANDVDGIDLSAAIQLDSYDHALTVATEGRGVALAAQPFVERDLRSKLLVAPFPSRVRANGDWYLVSRKSAQPSEKIDAFRQWLLEEMQADDEMQGLL